MKTKPHRKRLLIFQERDIRVLHFKIPQRQENIETFSSVGFFSQNKPKVTKNAIYAGMSEYWVVQRLVMSCIVVIFVPNEVSVLL